MAEERRASFLVYFVFLFLYLEKVSQALCPAAVPNDVFSSSRTAPSSNSPSFFDSYVVDSVFPYLCASWIGQGVFVYFVWAATALA